MFFRKAFDALVLIGTGGVVAGVTVVEVKAHLASGFCFDCLGDGRESSVSSIPI
jgi:hypothetical protein